ncbi:hypothetical protein JYU34_016114 [Plutella xylostella]|uniref:EGF-like domain-containing protein n=1 Tax=Plutella xylostella TaxID=51655 RepID=A0ABQ7Q6G9_PLUXY|nr:hypothetical protein JYU34_016114 [Plutella xylostella]
MRAPHAPVAKFTLFILSVALVLCQEDEGYIAVMDYQDDAGAIDIVDSETSCPTDRLLRMRDMCHFDGADVPCIRLRCCDGYVHIAGRCIHKSVDPCSLSLCEQSCEVRGDDVWCTCKPGFRFHADHYRKKIQPYCVDIDECAVDNGGCEQACVNDPGGFHCACAKPYRLTVDGRCEPPPPVPVAIVEPLPLVRASSRCFAPCDAVTRLVRRVKQLADQLQTLQDVLRKMSEEPGMGEHDDRFPEGTYSNRVLDSIAPLEGGYCRCPPGMEGPRGTAGERGPRGARGPPGSMDFMLLLVNELRHDITNIEAKVYGEGEKPERYDVKKAWRRIRKHEEMDQERMSQQELKAYTAPPVMVTGAPVEISPNGQSGAVTPDGTDGTTDWGLRSDTEPFDSTPPARSEVEEQLRHLNLLANSTSTNDEEEEELADYDYSFY